MDIKVHRKYIVIMLIIIICSGLIGIKYLFENRLMDASSGEETIIDSVADTIKDKECRKLVCLTFDDGPSDNTEKVADILKENSINATFFMIGSQITGNYEETVKRLYGDGNMIGVHSFTHDAKCIYCSEDAFYNDIMKTEERIVKLLGITPLVYRFPWGSDNCYIKCYRKSIIKRLKKKGLYYCDWNVSGEDSVGNPSASAIYANVKKNYKQFNNPVVLLHDSSVNNETVNALPDIIKLYRNAGYDFGTLNERDSLLQWK